MSTASEMVAQYRAAELAVLKGQSYMISTGTGSRQLTRANLAEIRAGRREWEQRLAAENARSQGGSSDYSVADWSS